jgi:hypothetical protein
MLNINQEFISKDQIRKQAPSIFTAQGAPGTSEKYAHIPTDKIIDDMSALGWNVVDAKEVKARKSVGFQKHLVVFRNNDIQITAEDGDNVFPQILLTNSHDGKNAFTFTAGLFRMVCENGLVVSSREFENMKIRHYGYSFEELQNTIKSMVEKLPLTVESLNKFRAVELGQEQALDFAKKALELRFTVMILKTFKSIYMIYLPQLVYKIKDLIYGQFITLFKRKWFMECSITNTELRPVKLVKLKTSNKIWF